MKPKRNPPSWKKRQRYVVFRVTGEEKFKKELLLSSLKKTGARFFGEMEFARIRPWLADFDFATQTGILRTDSKKVGEAKSILLLTAKIGERKSRISTLGVSGTIKKAREKFCSRE